jgi:hypothetical protein
MYSPASKAQIPHRCATDICPLPVLRGHKLFLQVLELLVTQWSGSLMRGDDTVDLSMIGIS